MQLGADGFFGLTYCSNIHPANGLQEVLASLERHAPALKERLSPSSPFGIGLRLSGAESRELLDGDKLTRFAAWLRERGLYVFSLNGFPYGPFHKQPVKADVHAPDWTTDARVDYTLRLIEILATLLPDGLDGSISTNPLSYKAWIDQTDRGTWERLASNVARVATEMARVKREQGKLLHLDLEPEPDGLLERSDEVVRFFDEWLPKPEQREHVRVCFDTCHMAVAYEDPADVFDCFEAAGIRVGKIQVSSALDVDLPARRDEAARALRPFADPIYLHQVTQRNRDGSLQQFPDLDDALRAIDDQRAENWRIHFHTPLFVEQYGDFRSTQDWILRTFEDLGHRRSCRILEIETYTWDVLPPDLKCDLTDSIAREYAWVLDALGHQVAL
jgi:sugar phosphate isomerase/epimerase